LKKFAAVKKDLFEVSVKEGKLEGKYYMPWGKESDVLPIPGVEAKGGSKDRKVYSFEIPEKAKAETFFPILFDSFKGITLTYTADKKQGIALLKALGFPFMEETK